LGREEEVEGVGREEALEVRRREENSKEKDDNDVEGQEEGQEEGVGLEDEGMGVCFRIRIPIPI
jgi:hypothetical protein